MKKYLVISFLFIPMTMSLTPMHSLNVQLPHVQKITPIQVDPIQQRDDLIAALIQVESSGNDKAYNESEDAVGCLQIRRVMVREVNRILRRTNSKDRYDMADRWNCDKSKEMFNIWREYHHADSEYETIARNWNGGPKGYSMRATERYWKKVQNHLDSK